MRSDLWLILSQVPMKIAKLMYCYAGSCLSLLICSTLMIDRGFAAPAGPVERAAIFHDTFRPRLGPGWRWIREEPKHWRIGADGLEVHIQPGNMWGPANDAKNLLVRVAPDAKERPIEIVAAVHHEPTHQYEQVDLVWYYNDSNMVKVGEELVDGKLSVVMGREQADKTRTISITPLDSKGVELRMRVSENRIIGSFRTPGGNWREVGQCDMPAKGAPSISLQFYQGPADVEHWAKVSDFVIRPWAAN